MLVTITGHYFNINPAMTSTVVFGTATPINANPVLSSKSMTVTTVAHTPGQYIVTVNTPGRAVVSPTNFQFDGGQTTWLGAVNSNWSNAGNWDNGVPATASQAVLTGNGNHPTNQDIPSLSLTSLAINGPDNGAYTITGNAIGLISAITSLSQAADSAAVTVGIDIALSNGAAWNINNNLTANGVISGAGGFNMQGTGALVVTNSNNSYAGSTTVSGGSLSVSALGNGGGDGMLGASSAASTNLVLNGGTLIYTGAGSFTNRGLSINANSTINVGTGPLTITGIIAGTNNLTKTGAGQLVLNATNTYAGGTTLNGGEIVAKASNALGTGNAAINNTSDVLIDNGSNYTLGNPFTLNSTNPAGTLISSGGTQTLNGAITATVPSTIAVNANSVLAAGLITGAKLSKLGAGELVVANPSSTYANLDVNAGKVTAALGGALGSGTVNLAGGNLGIGVAATTFNGFGGNGNGWSANNGATIANDVALLTDNLGNEARSVFFNTKLSISKFTASFIYQETGNGPADGATFCIQNAAANAFGQTGGALGYGGGALGNSVAFEINIYQPNTPGIALRTNGATGAPYGTTGNVNVASGDPILVTLVYDGTNVTATLKDTTTSAAYTQLFPVDIPGTVGATTAFVGFTAGTGGAFATQQISSFSYTTSVTGPATFANTIVVNSFPSTIELGVASASFPSIALNSAGTLKVAPSAFRANANYILNFTQGMSFANNQTLDVAANGTGAGTLALAGMSDVGTPVTITKANSGTLSLTGTSSGLTANDVLNVTGGAVEVDANGALGTSTDVNLSASTNLNIKAFVVVAGSINGAGTTSFTDGPATLTIGTSTNHNSIITNAITDAGAVKPGTLIKAGGGSLTLGGTNTYMGNTTVNGGALTVAATGNLPPRRL